MNFKCPLCGQATKHVWTSKNGGRLGFKCKHDHTIPPKKKWSGIELIDDVDGTDESRKLLNPVFLVDSKEA